MLSSLSLNALRLTRFPQIHSKPSQTPRLRLGPISASLFDQKKKNPDSLIPSSPSPSPQLYQPFRPPPSPLPPQFRDLDVNGRIEALSNRLGRWFEYAPLIPTLIQEGFAPPALAEVTGISGVEQNRLVVGAQIRDSLIASGTDSAVIEAFDQGGAEILYEIRLLSTQQRSAAASFMVSRGMDAKAAMELARAVKDFPRRKGDKGWESFDYTHPGDSLAFMYFRQAKEHKNPSEQRTMAMEQALAAAQSEAAKKRVSAELSSGKPVEEEVEIEGAKVPVVRLKMGEIAEATKVVVLPVAKASEGSKNVRDAPRECRSEGDFGVVTAEKPWDQWAVLPAWGPLAGFLGGVAVAFGDARALPWTANRWYKEEPILVVADRGRTTVDGDDGFYLIEESGGGLRVDRGSALRAAAVGEALGAVILVVRPPKDEGDDEAMDDEDWD